MNLEKLLFVLFSLFSFFLCSIGYSEENKFHQAVAKSPAPGTLFLYPERIFFKNGPSILAYRGLFFVPMNRTKAKSEVISVEIYWFRALNLANRQKTPIFKLPGGPGFQGLEKRLESNNDYYERSILPFQKIADVVIVGQRGIGSSRPNTLIDITTSSQDPALPFDAKKALEEEQKIHQREKAFWEKQGVDLSGLNVLEAADDVNEIRQALGYKKIILWGGSFGSHWSMTLMRRYPEIVERAVLSGVEGPNHTYDHPGYLWNVFKNVAQEAEKDPVLKNYIPKGGLIKALETVLARVKKNPVKVKVLNKNTQKLEEVLITPRVIREVAPGLSRNLYAWPAHILNLYANNFETVAHKILDRNKERFLLSASFFMIDNGSGITPEKEKEMLNDPAVEFLGDINQFYRNTRKIWGSDLGNEFRKNFKTSIPTLIVQGNRDLSTPFENALELAPYFINGKLIEIHRGSHSAIYEAMKFSPTFKKQIFNFVATGEKAELPEKLELPLLKWELPLAEKNKKGK